MSKLGRRCPTGFEDAGAVRLAVAARAPYAAGADGDSNKGSSMFDPMPEGSFLACRIVPMADEWMLSGVCSPLPASSRREVYETVLHSFATGPTATG